MRHVRSGCDKNVSMVASVVSCRSGTASGGHKQLKCIVHSDGGACLVEYTAVETLRTDGITRLCGRSNAAAPVCFHLYGAISISEL